MWRDHGTTLVVALLVLPVAAVAGYAWRRRSRPRRAALAETGMVVGTAPWLVMLFTPQPAGRSVDLVPLDDLPSWFAAGPSTAAAQLGGNLLVLAALGALLPVRWPVGLPQVAAVALAAAAAIEAGQWVAAVGRVSSIDDVLVNTLGAVLAAAASRPWWAARPPVLNAR